MEDLDKPREIKGAADDILRTLEAFGFEWESDVLCQSQRDEIYAEAFSKPRLVNSMLRMPAAYSALVMKMQVAASL